MSASEYCEAARWRNGRGRITRGYALSRAIVIQLTVTRRGLITAVVVLALVAAVITWGSVTGAANAAAKAGVVCVAADGTVESRAKCGKGETVLAAGSYVTKELPGRTPKPGRNIMSAPKVLGGATQRSDEELPVGESLAATSIAQTSLFSYTARYDIPAGWVGSIVATCPDFAPIGIYFGGQAVPNTLLPVQAWNPNSNGPGRGWWDSTGRFASVRAIGPTSEAAVVYLSQVCAPIVGLEPQIN